MRPIEEAWKALVRAHGPRLRVLLSRLVGGGAQDLEDLAQETWLAVLKRSDCEVRGLAHWGYIRAVAVNKVRDRFRSAEKACEPLPAEVPTPTPSPRPRESEFHLGVLPGEARAALVLFYWEGLSLREVAEALQVKVGTVKTWMHRARSELRAQMEAGFDPSS